MNTPLPDGPGPGARQLLGRAAASGWLADDGAVVDRSALAELVAAGIQVETQGEGWRITPAFVPLDPAWLSSHLPHIALECHWRIDSTQTRARALARAGAGPALVVAEAQDAGQGQRGRRWCSPLGANLYLSLCWPSRRRLEQLSGLSLAVGLSLRRGLASFGLDLRLKWPNDLWIDGRKLGGVLVEVLGEGQQGSLCVIGIGINHRMEQTLARDIGQAWTDLTQLLDPLPDRNLLLIRLLPVLLADLERFDASGFAAFHPEWVQADGLAAAQVTLRAGSELVRGQVLGVDEAGRLLLKTKGRVRAFASGELEKSGLMDRRPG